MSQINKRQSIYLVLAYQFLLLLVLNAVCRLGFFLVNQNLFKQLSAVEIAYTFWGGIKFDVVALLYINLLYIVLQAIPLPFKYDEAYQKATKWIFIVTNSIGFLANFMDFAYFCRPLQFFSPYKVTACRVNSQ